MNEIQARRYITEFERNGINEQKLVRRIKHTVGGELETTAAILQAVDLYVDQESIHAPANPNIPKTGRKHTVKPGPSPARKVARMLNDPGRAFDRWSTKKYRQTKRKAARRAKTWARQNIGRPIVRAAARLAGEKIKL
ncbi:MAG: hypothetical protein GY803_27545 [Chloroflexi bacterium]|nr:hypothetical protein [Chloroflexota bacterium]